MKINIKYMVCLMLLMVITGCGGNISSTAKKVNAPTFTLPQYGAKSEVTLAERLGKPVVLNFWSTT
ncbi:MAG: hypothetical protein ACM3NT_00845 [Methylocystaceae bacterium]